MTVAPEHSVRADSAAGCDLPIRVYIEDTDAGGIVYYVNYLKFMERARTEFMRQLGYKKAAMFADNRLFVVHSMQVDYLASAQLDDVIIASAKLLKVGKAAIVFEQTVTRDDQVLVRATVKIACIETESRKPAAIPAELLAKLAV